MRRACSNRPLKAAFAVAVVIGLAAIVLGAVGWLDVLLAGIAVICCALLAAVSGYAIWQGERALRSRLAEERARVGRIRVAQESRFAGQAEHATRVREWQALRVADEQSETLVRGLRAGRVHRVDIAGGTLSGWSAMLTTAGATGWRPAARSPCLTCPRGRSRWTCPASRGRSRRRSAGLGAAR